MEYSYIIEGKRAAHGEIQISGSEELAFIGIILSILSDGPITLKNVAQTGRIMSLLDTLRFLGSDVQVSGSQVVVDSTRLTTKVVPQEQTHDSVYEAMLLGVLGITSGRAAVRFKNTKSTEELSLHLLLLDELFSKKLGEIDGYSTVEGTLVGDVYTLPEKLPSLTMHALLLTVVGNGSFTLRNTVHTSSVDALIQFLIQLGAQIETGFDYIQVTQTARLSSGTLQLPSDVYESTFWVALSLITDGEITLENVSQRQVAPLLSKIEQLHARYKLERETLHVWHEDQPLGPLELSVQRSKGIDDRLARMLAAITTKAHGHSRFIEQELHTVIWDESFLQMFEIEGSSNNDPNGSELNVFGPSHITGKKIDIISPLFAESALLLALAAEGATTLQVPIDLFTLYHDFETKLSNLGMTIHTI